MSYVHTYSAKILADSISQTGHRISTLEVTIPRIVLAEFNTHRVFSRNSASSRAIPVRKMIKRVMEHPYIPSSWGKNQKGMQPGGEVDKATKELAVKSWLGARDDAVCRVETLLNLGIHKQFTNRLLEPWLWHTIIVTATEWSNFFNLRCSPDAQIDIRLPAELIKRALQKSHPVELMRDEWHLPLVSGVDYEDNELYERYEISTEGVRRDPDWDWQKWLKISSARCARVSYLTHDGKRDLESDLELHDKLLESGHMSPFEHPARPMTEQEHYTYRQSYATCENGQRVRTGAYIDPDDGLLWHVRGSKVLDVEHTFFCGNFNGWVSYRKEIPGEEDIHKHRGGA